MLRLLMRVIVPIGIGLPALLVGMIWWQERPLRNAEEALGRSDADQALRIIEEYLQQNPPHDRALAIKARALVALGRWSEADRLFSRIGPATIEDLHSWATALLHLQQWAHALPLLERVLQIDPDHTDALHETAACRANLGDVDGALRTAQRLSRIPGLEAAASLQIATLQDRRGNYPSAVKAWEQLLEHRPDASDLGMLPQEIFGAYAVSLHKVGRPDDAVRAVERSLALEPSARGYSLRGEVQLSLGDEDAAIESWTTAVRLDPGDASARIGLAQSAIQGAAPQTAIEWLQPIVSSGEVDSGSAFLLQRAYTMLEDDARAAEWQQRADSLRRREQLESAMNQLLRESPLSFWSQVVYAHRFATAGNWGQAEVLIEALLEQAPEEPFVLELYEAIRRRAPPPPLDRLPAQQF